MRPNQSDCRISNLDQSEGRILCHVTWPRRNVILKSGTEFRYWGLVPLGHHKANHQSHHKNKDLVFVCFDSFVIILFMEKNIVLSTSCSAAFWQLVMFQAALLVLSNLLHSESFLVFDQF